MKLVARSSSVFNGLEVYFSSYVKLLNLLLFFIVFLLKASLLCLILTGFTPYFLDENLQNVPQRRRNHSLSPRRIIPFDVFERNYQAHMRSHSVSPAPKS